VPQLGCACTLVVSGGVAANMELRRRLQALCDRSVAPGQKAVVDGECWQLVLPPPRLCTDNGVMVAWAAIEALYGGVAHEPAEQQVRARWPLGRLAANAAEMTFANPQDRGAKRRARSRKGVEYTASS
jgi:N6-L-threonylcarbamoyladenine synthase